MFDLIFPFLSDEIPSNLHRTVINGRRKSTGQLNESSGLRRKLGEVLIYILGFTNLNAILNIKTFIHVDLHVWKFLKMIYKK